MFRKMLFASLLLIGGTAIGQDRYFARTYTSNVLPAGSVDLEVWHTSRMGHQGQYYHAQDQRFEVEVGLGGHLQTALYFNRYQNRFSTTADGTTTSNESGFSNEWKWQLKQAFGKKTGVALYGEWGIKGGDEFELETKLILDKTIGKNLFAMNVELEMERGSDWVRQTVVKGEKEFSATFDLAYMYNVNPALGIGWELVDQNAITNEHGWEYSTLYGGPTVNYRGQGWFIIANLLPQMTNLHRTAEQPRHKVLDEKERMEARILIGVSLR